jgi:ABC-type phosphate transport system substrate-binding protein
MFYKHSLTFTWAVLIASMMGPSPVLAQVLAQAGPALPAGTQVKISDSSQMAPINQSLKQIFEEQYPNAKIAIQSGDTVANINAVLAGKIDLASISRPLTSDEQSQGLVQVPVAREKIAIVIGTANPFQGSLTIEQVNQIMTGEITNWKQVGGDSRPIRVIQRPATSNAMQALQQYPDLRTTLAGKAGNQPLVTIDGLAAALGKDGLSFALMSELSGREGIQALAMYGTWPANKRYPFSQPFTYVYKKKASPAVQTFLNFVANEAGQQAVETAIATPKSFVTGPAAASAQPAATPQPAEDKPVAAPAQGQEDAGLNQIDWLPLILSLLGLGLLALAVLRATAIRQKQHRVPKPAPDYANRVKTEMSPAAEPKAETNVLGLGGIAGIDLEADASPTVEQQMSPQEVRQRDYIVPEFVEFNTQVQAAATQLQATDSQDIDSRSSEADTQLQDETTQIQSPQEPEERD